MAQYIDKSTLVAEIEKRKKELIELNNDFANQWACASLDNILSFINTLEVKEMDLEDDVDKILEANDWNFDKIDFYKFAEHFFELGMNVKLKDIDTTHNIDAILEEKGIDIESREVKAFKEAFYNAIDTYLPKAQKEK